MNFAFLADGKSCALGWGKVERSSEALKNAFYINDFDLSDGRPWCVFENTHAAADTAELLPFLAELPVASEWYLPAYEAFQEDFLEVQGHFKEGSLKKILLSACELGESGSARRTLKKVPDSGHYFYGFKLGEQGAWGLSPELLFRSTPDKRLIETVALAGTYAEKTEARHVPEHSAVIDFFHELATRLDLRIQIAPTAPADYGKIKHLKSAIRFENVPERNLNAWVRDFHPTPALGVAPRNDANMQFLKILRKKLPEFFGAPFGFVNQVQLATLIVMIRGTFFKGAELYRPIGVGVTAASSLKGEWEEIILKRLALEDLWNPLI